MTRVVHIHGKNPGTKLKREFARGLTKAVQKALSDPRFIAMVMAKTMRRHMLSKVRSRTPRSTGRTARQFRVTQRGANVYWHSTDYARYVHFRQGGKRYSLNDVILQTYRDRAKFLEKELIRAAMRRGR